jgi:probable HAF family extracellular repeat protein
MGWAGGVRARRGGRRRARPGPAAALLAGLLSGLLGVAPAVPGWAQGAPPPPPTAGARPAPGAVVALAGTPHIWVADEQGVLHWAGDTRALEGRAVDWGRRSEVTAAELRALPRGDPWLSTGLLEDGGLAYLPKWEAGQPAPVLLLLAPTGDLELFGLTPDRTARQTLARTAWERRYDSAAGGLARGTLRPPAGAPAPAVAAAYTVTDLGPLPDLTTSGAEAINAAGQVVGSARARPDAVLERAVRWDGRGAAPLPDLGGERSAALALNDAGQVVGLAWRADDESGTPDRAVLWDRGAVVELAPDSVQSVALDINAAGQIVGFARARRSSPAWKAVLWEGGRTVELEPLPGAEAEQSMARAISASGQIVGEAAGPDGRTRAVRWDGRTPVVLGGLPGGGESRAMAVNAAGQAVGDAETAGGATRALLWDGGRVVDLGALPGGGESQAHAIDAAGRVVGASTVVAPAGRSAGLYALPRHAVLWERGAIVDLNDRIPANSGWELIDARAINASGQIAGQGIVDGRLHAYVLTPIVPAR